MEKYERIQIHTAKKACYENKEEDEDEDDDTQSESSRTTSTCTKASRVNDDSSRCSGKNRSEAVDEIFSYPDRSFLASMLPDMSAMTQAQKRKFKIGVLNLVGDILRGDEEIEEADDVDNPHISERYRPGTTEEIFAYPDRSFLASMLPDMRMMTKSEKRRFKIGALNLVEEIIHGDDRGGPTTFKWLDEDKQHINKPARRVNF